MVAQATPAPVPTSVPTSTQVPAPTTPDVSSWLTPTLTSNPGLASDVANTPGNKVDAATVVSHANNVVNAQTAVQEHIATQGTQGFWSRLVGDVETPLNWVGKNFESGVSAINHTQIGGDVLNTLSFLGKPLQEVQKDYKFIHAVYADHGVLPGLLATLGVAGGVGIGAAFGGGVGGAAGGDIAASVIRSVLGEKYADSAAQANNPNYKISFGRDFSNFLGKVSDAVGADGIGDALENTNKGLGKFVSGMTDTVGDYTVDPVMVLAKANMAMKSGRFLSSQTAGDSFTLQAKYPLARVIPGVNNFLAAHSMRAFSPEQVDAVRAGGSMNAQANGYNRALNFMADIGKKANNATLQVKANLATGLKDSTHADLAAGNIAFNFPQLGTDTAGRLGAIVTQDLPKSQITDQIHDFIKTNVYFNELDGTLAGPAILPSRTVIHPLQSVADYLRDNPNAAGTIYKTFSGYMPFSVDPVMQKISTEEFRWNAPDTASVIYRYARFGQNSHQYGLEMAGQYATAIAKGGANGLAEARLLNGQITFDALKSMGLPDDNSLVTKVKNTIDQLNGEKETGSGMYGVAPSERGANISDYVTTDGKHANAAIAGWQASEMLPIPNFLVAKRALRDLGLIGGKNFGVAGKVSGFLDDFVADNYTNKFFKPLALATAGFGLRVAASELLLAASRYGPAKLIQAKIAASAAKSGYSILPDEGSHFIAAVLTGLGVAKGIPTTLASDIYPAFQYAKAKGMQYAAKLTADEQLDIAARAVARHDGSIVAPPVSSGHGDVPVNSYESQQNIHSIFQKQKSSLQFRDDPTWTTYTKDSKDFAGRYATQLAHFKADPMGQNVAGDIANVFSGKAILPKNVSFKTQISPEGLSGVDETGSTHYSNLNKISVHTQSGDEIAWLTWEKDTGKIQTLDVSRVSNSQNIANAMLQKATELSKEHSLPLPIQHPDADGLQKRLVKNFLNINKVNTVTPSVNNPAYMAMRKKVIDNETQRILDTKAGTYQPYKHEMNTNTRWVDQDPRAFAADRVDTILGLGIGSDGTVNHNIFNGLANGQAPGINDIHKMPKNSLPAEVAGPEISPYQDSKTLLNRVISTGFKKVFNPIINGLSREPLYILHVGEEYGSMKYAISQGALTPEQAFTIAETRAVHAMLPQIHNTMLKTQFAVAVRNFLPFYFAQEQAWKRTLLAMKNTSVLSPVFSNTVRTYQIVEHLISNPAFVTKDSSGNSYANIPVVGAWGQAAQSALARFGVPMISGLPITVSGSMSSLKSVLPTQNILPGVSPFIAIGGNLAADWFPGLAPIIDKGLGQSAGRGFWDTVDPNGMSKSIWQALSPNDQNTAMNNAIIGALVSAYYHNDPGFSPQATHSDKEAMIDRAKNNARSILLIKAALNMLSPLAPKVEQIDPNMRQEFLNLVKSKGSFPDALLPFLGEHGDSAISYTIAKSYASVPGATIPSVTTSIQWLKDNSALVHNPKTSTGALYLIPQETSKNSQDIAVYQDLLRQHLRSVRTPMEFLNQLYISAGDQAISPLMAIHKARVATMTTDGDTVGLSQEATAWSGVMAKMKNLYPTWFATYNSNASQANASVALGQFKTIFAGPNAPTNEQAQQVKALVNDYDVHAARMTDAKQTGDNTVVKVEKTAWTDYLTNLEKNDPRLKSVITSVFMKLD